MRLFLKIVAGVILLGVAVYVLVMLLTAGERKLATEFVTLASTGEVAAARDLLHSELQKEFTVDRLSAELAGVKPYTDISFGSVETTAGSGTQLEGTAKTADGCSSRATFDILDGKIIAFSITPLCRD